MKNLFKVNNKDIKKDENGVFLVNFEKLFQYLKRQQVLLVLYTMYYQISVVPSEALKIDLFC